MDALRTLLNLVWLVLQGWLLALAYALAGLIACLLVVTIPFGIASFRLAAVGLFPLGKRVVETAPPRDWVHAGSGVVQAAPVR